MGRTRTKTKESAPVVDKSISTSSHAPPSVESLLSKAQDLIVQCDYGLARKFIDRILERSDISHSDNAQAREMLGIVLLETGEVQTAKEVFLTLVSPHAEAPSPTPPSAHLYIAQLSDDDPHRALAHYQSAIDLLQVQLKGKEKALLKDSRIKNEDEMEVRSNLVRAYIGMVEIWMDPVYDLCFDPDVEKTCENLLGMALKIDPGNAEALQTLASVRMSQQRPDDAKVCLEQVWATWKDLELDDSRMPAIPTRLVLVRLFLELSLFAPALLVLQGVLASDDQEVEAWYLEGWAFFLMSEQARESGEAVEGLGWEDLGHDARECLEMCRLLHNNQGHPDAPLVEHTIELIGKLDALGVQSPSADTDGDGDAEDEYWMDEEKSEDGDVDMSG